MEDMSEEACQELLKGSSFGDLALAQEGRAYVIPLFFGYDGEHVYFQCHPGVKDDYIDSTEQACLVVTHVESANVWESVHVFGTVEKVTLNTDIHDAKAALLSIPHPPAKGHYPKGMPVRSDQNVYYLKMTPTQIYGRESAFKKEQD